MYMEQMKAQTALAIPTKQTRVASYLRVSNETGATLDTRSVKSRYYRQRILNHPDWNCVGVYCDSGVAGTDPMERTGFRRMMADCEAGEIDLVLAESMSRIARNICDVLRAVDYMDHIGVELSFEKENLITTSAERADMVSLRASSMRLSDHSN